MENVLLKPPAIEIISGYIVPVGKKSVPLTDSSFSLGKDCALPLDSFQMFKKLITLAS